MGLNTTIKVVTRENTTVGDPSYSQETENGSQRSRLSIRPVSFFRHISLLMAISTWRHGMKGVYHLTSVSMPAIQMRLGSHDFRITLFL